MAGRVLVSVADGHAIDDVAAACSAAGLQVEKVLRGVGVVVGTCDDEHRDGLSAVTGVGAVEPDREVRLDPPDSGVQ
ncbi:hypothetical protein Ae168Ps1_5333c [Pseudonocardia sp. Ae168_Ps1]|uniref:hypothetical protein n=1 Tax=unclassified Pseudonocardia TaxID=2619320 RepID=UPI0001FFE278|nr:MULTISPECIES: hypothetical protein [unclassified Pseudonocardia]ALL77695.1 hypothetical protein AD006_24640 [Pseudonocardia sp. EC080610-09]ALL80611.1 hypothetical protein AD017_04230 [Pseudonocardia sp. EC080619-01]OLL76911.1 hypothetical protein Ae150APs1_5289c [Pseudonocardia sp. Ae150A_Ps1]OLL82927.1 hypothetical protein Ae168Ps1_5333c [Pseudonocardia sp. Ae168_Ps1]OLL82964.1 hypothetical protein Ae263Ps1_0019 [Pseudonocardia sp. Ae263_Ps1]